MALRICRMLAGLMFMAVMLLAGFQPAYGEPAGKKATWVWQTELINDGGERLLRFAREEGINLIYLQINRSMSKEKYEKFVSRAHEQQVEIHALGGDPRWAFNSRLEDMLGLADWVLNYNESTTPNKRFDGIHLDIKPYALNEWDTNQDRIISSWVSNIDVFLKKVSGSNLELGIDIPFWWDDLKLPGGESLNKWLMEAFDHTTVLAYRNMAETDNGIINKSKDEIELADRLGKQVFIAVDTKKRMGENHTSFYGLGREKLDQALGQLNASFGNYDSFAGVAVHDFNSFANIAKAEGDGGSNSDGSNPGHKPEPDPESKPEPVPKPDQGTENRVPSASPVERDPAVRGTYIWEAREVIENSQEILEFAKEKDLNWLYVRLDLQQPYESYQSFVKQAAEAGIEVHALGGHPIWARKENQAKMLRLVEYVKEYNRAAQGPERFHGIHLDIEPYVLPDWLFNNEQIISEWTANIETFVQELKKDSDLEASIDMAVWLDKYKVPGTNIPLSKWMIRQLDHVTLMAFRDMADGRGGIAYVVKEEIAFADELNKPIIISVEMKESHEGEHITFYEEGAAYMEKELAKLPELLGYSSSYTGEVVHAYEYWRKSKRSK